MWQTKQRGRQYNAKAPEDWRSPKRGVNTARRSQMCLKSKRRFLKQPQKNAHSTESPQAGNVLAFFCGEFGGLRLSCVLALFDHHRSLDVIEARKANIEILVTLLKEWSLFAAANTAAGALAILGIQRI